MIPIRQPACGEVRCFESQRLDVSRHSQREVSTEIQAAAGGLFCSVLWHSRGFRGLQKVKSGTKQTMAPATVDPHPGEAAMPQGHGAANLMRSVGPGTAGQWV